MTSIARDIKLYYNPLTRGEFSDVYISQGDFVFDDGLENMVLISLFSDAYVDKSQSYNGKCGGFFAENILGFNLGSKLWQLDRAKITRKDTLVLAAQYAKEALDWMVDAGIYSKVETYAQKDTARTDSINLYIAAYKPDTGIDQYKYNTQWVAQLGGA